MCGRVEGTFFEIGFILLNWAKLRQRSIVSDGRTTFARQWDSLLLCVERLCNCSMGELCLDGGGYVVAPSSRLTSALCPVVADRVQCAVTLGLSPIG